MNEILLTNFHLAAFAPFFNLNDQRTKGEFRELVTQRLNLKDCVSKFPHSKNKRKWSRFTYQNFYFVNPPFSDFENQFRFRPAYFDVI